MSRDWQLYLLDIRDACIKVISYASEMSQTSFLEDTKTYDAVLRNIEILGEAATHLPDEVTARMASIDWRNVIGMRNILAHAYHRIDDHILWKVIQNNVPMILGAVEDFLRQQPA